MRLFPIDCWRGSCQARSFPEGGGRARNSSWALSPADRSYFHRETKEQQKWFSHSWVTRDFKCVFVPAQNYCLASCHHLYCSVTPAKQRPNRSLHRRRLNHSEKDSCPSFCYGVLMKKDTCVHFFIMLLLENPLGLLKMSHLGSLVLCHRETSFSPPPPPTNSKRAPALGTISEACMSLRLLTRAPISWQELSRLYLNFPSYRERSTSQGSPFHFCASRLASFFLSFLMPLSSISYF